MSDRHTPSNLESLVRLLKADGGMSWASTSCTCSRCRLMREIDVELERFAGETARKPDGYLIQYGDRVSAYAGSLDSNVFENLKADGIAHTVTPLFAIPTLGAAVWLPPKTNEPHSGGEPS